MQIRLWRRSANIVTTLDLEEYLRGVVPAEMPASWPLEGLKAQAVAARAYAVRAITSPRHPDRGADLCDTAQCQAWSSTHYASSDRAVAETAGETWPGPCQYVSKCGRPDCPYCKGTGGFNGQTWTGRLCQYGAAKAAEQGMNYKQILTLYYGAGPEAAPGTVFIPGVASPATDWGRYPKPPNDTGAGVHGGANASHPLGDNDGLIPGILDEMKRMGLRWVKLLDRDGSSYNACRLVLAAGMMPVVRLYRERPYPGMLTGKQLEAAKLLAGIGVRYFERGNEPNLDLEWQVGRWPSYDWNAWTPEVFRSLAVDWVGDADFLASLGAFVAVDALAGGGNYDDILYLQRFLGALRDIGATPLLKDRGWLAVHNAGLNHPMSYPDDPINQAEHAGQTIHTHFYADGSPTGASNCIRKWEAVHKICLDVTGLDLPVICTEGGWWVGSKNDKRYPEIDLIEQGIRQAETLRGMAGAPPWLLSQMPWLWFNRKGANPEGGFERDAWVRWPGFGTCPANEPAELPLLQMLRENPCLPRGVAPADVGQAIAAAMQADVVPFNPNTDFARAAKDRGLVVASDERIKTVFGVSYLAQVFRDPRDLTLQHIVYCIKGDSGKLAWTTKKN